MKISGYDKLVSFTVTAREAHRYNCRSAVIISYSDPAHQVKTFQDTPIPTFISEYGTNVRSPRPFDETRAILSRDMTDTFSGGVVYEFFQGLSQYGIVDRGEDGSLVRRPDFVNFANSVRACRDVRHNTSLTETPEGQAIVMRRPGPPQTGDHLVSAIFPYLSPPI